MTKASRATPHPDQIAFSFEAPARVCHEAELAGLDRVVAAGVARALKEDERSRDEIAGAMSALLAEEVSKYMLDAYASAAREGHNISVGRLLALVAVTDRFDILDEIVTRAGARILVGEEVHAAHLGHLQAELKRLQDKVKVAQRRASPIVRGGPRG